MHSYIVQSSASGTASLPTPAASASGDAGRRFCGDDKEANGDRTDVWEFTEDDLDNVGSAAPAHGSDDDWACASVTTLHFPVGNDMHDGSRIAVHDIEIVDS